MTPGQTYIIAEIGQNHNGSVAIAKMMIDLAVKQPKEYLFGIEIKPVDAIKLCKRDLTEECTASFMNSEYNSPNSFGQTYGEHRAALELTDEQHLAIFRHAKGYGLDVIETICSPKCLRLLDLFTPDAIKVASRDLSNIPLIEAMADTELPIILSTGMSNMAMLDKAITVIRRRHERISIMHCVSEYPTRPENVNLLTIKYLIEAFPQYKIGYSDHTIGISAAVAAVALGAKFIEKHITIDRRLKGTDQAGALGPDGLYRMVRDIRLTDMSMGESGIYIPKCVLPAKRKLERSLSTRKAISKGERFTEGDFIMLSPGGGYQWHERTKIIGRRALTDIPSHEQILKKHIYEKAEKEHEAESKG